MSADLYAWEPSLGLDPRRRDFSSRLDQILESPNPAPATPKMRAFVHALLARYPDLTDGNAGSTVWADGPLLGDVSGGFINVSLIWSRYREARPFFLRTAASFHLNAYDPQDDAYFPVLGRQRRNGLAALMGAALTMEEKINRRDAIGAALGIIIADRI